MPEITGGTTSGTATFTVPVAKLTVSTYMPPATPPVPTPCTVIDVALVTDAVVDVGPAITPLIAL